MWFICSICTFTFWALADLFYKKQANRPQYSFIMTTIIVGCAMGINGFIYLVLSGTKLDFFECLKYLPVSFFYISSMMLGYKGLKYLNISIISPIQNSSGVITSALLFLIFHDKLETISIIGIILVGIGVFALSYLEGKKEIEENKNQNSNLKQKLTVIGIIFPIMYLILDGMGTFLDSVYLDKLELVSKDTALLSYEFTFFIFAICLIIYLKIKGENFTLLTQKDNVLAATFETIGQVTYVWAISGNSILAAPIVGAYSIGSVILARIFLKEELSLTEYILIIIVLIGIICLGFE